MEMNEETVYQGLIKIALPFPHCELFWDRLKLDRLMFLKKSKHYVKACSGKEQGKKRIHKEGSESEEDQNPKPQKRQKLELPSAQEMTVAQMETEIKTLTKKAKLKKMNRPQCIEELTRARKEAYGKDII